jgi:hypothetical protein
VFLALISIFAVVFPFKLALILVTSFCTTKGGGYSNGANDDIGKMCFNAAKVSQKEIVII